jgi:hypothetical protein
VVQIDVANGKARLIRQLTPGDRAGVMQVLTVAATPDARTFAYSYQRVLTPPSACFVAPNVRPVRVARCARREFETRDHFDNALSVAAATTARS